MRDTQQRFSRTAEFENFLEALFLETLVADRQYMVEPANVAFILDDEWLEPDAAVAAATS